jgi:hypothetical protein
MVNVKKIRAEVLAGNDPDRTTKTASEANFLTDCFIPKMVSRLAVLTVAENRDFS